MNLPVSPPPASWVADTYWMKRSSSLRRTARPRVSRHAPLTAAALVASLLATGCAVNLEYSRERMIDDLTEETVQYLEGQLPRAITPEETSCFRSQLGKLSTADLTTIYTAESENEIPPRLQERVASLLVACANAGGN